MTQLGQLYEKEKIEYANQKVREKTKEIAKSLLEDGTEIVKIMKVTGLTEEEFGSQEICAGGSEIPVCGAGCRSEAQSQS